MLFGTTGEGETHEDVFESGAGARKMGDLSRHDPELLAGFAGRVGVELGISQHDLDVRTSGGVDLSQ